MSPPDSTNSREKYTAGIDCAVSLSTGRPAFRARLARRLRHLAQEVVRQSLHRGKRRQHEDGGGGRPPSESLLPRPGPQQANPLFLIGTPAIGTRCNWRTAEST